MKRSSNRWSAGLFLLLAILGGMGPSPNWVLADSPKTLEFEKVEGNTLYFKGLKPITTPWRELHYIGTLGNLSEGNLYILVSAKPCENCNEDRALFFLKPDGNKKSYQFVFPGKILDPKTGSVLLEARAFFGKCSPTYSDSFVVFQKDLVEKRKKKKGPRFKRVEPSILQIDPDKEQLHEKLSELRSIGQLQARLRSTLLQVKRKACFEIEGRNRTMSLKPLDLKSKRDLLDQDDVDDEETDARSAHTQEEDTQKDTGSVAQSSRRSGSPAAPNPATSPTLRTH